MSLPVVTFDFGVTHCIPQGCCKPHSHLVTRLLTLAVECGRIAEPFNVMRLPIAGILKALVGLEIFRE